MVCRAKSYNIVLAEKLSKSARLHESISIEYAILVRISVTVRRIPSKDVKHFTINGLADAVVRYKTQFRVQ